MKDRNLASLFFKISGYLPEEIDDIIYRTKIVKQIAKERKVRKRKETEMIHRQQNADRDTKIAKNMIKRLHDRPTKAEQITAQIDRGFETAKNLMLPQCIMCHECISTKEFEARDGVCRKCWGQAEVKNEKTN